MIDMEKQPRKVQCENCKRLVDPSAPHACIGVNYREELELWRKQEEKWWEEERGLMSRKEVG